MAQVLVFGLFITRFFHDPGEDVHEYVTRTLRLIHSFGFPGLVFKNGERLETLVDSLERSEPVLNFVTLLKNADITWFISRNDHDVAARDPMIHLYEQFLQHYDPVRKKHRGVFYTPDPVVSFIIRSIDILLRTDFKLAGGLANGTREAGIDDRGKNSKNTGNQFLVQVLDPAAGTGTFLTHVIEHVKKSLVATALKPGQGDQVVDRGEMIKDEVLPRLLGFELMAVPCMLAMLKMHMLANEPGDVASGMHFPGNVIVADALEAGLKLSRNISVVVGNPPYARGSQNKNTSIEPLLKDYKDLVKSDKNIQALSDDYVKFIRLAQAIVDKNGWGIVGMITNHTFIKGPIFRGMRRSLAGSFQKIYILDLHGNTKIQEDIPEGMTDQNVFPIQQGVCIMFLVKSRDPAGEDTTIYHLDLFGSRAEKFTWLGEHDVSNMSWTVKINPSSPDYAFVPGTMDARVHDEYNTFLPLDKIFPYHNVGGKPGDDNLFIALDKKTVLKQIDDFLSQARGNSDPGNLTEAKRKLLALSGKFTVNEANVIEYTYRPFDKRFAYYDAQAWTRAVTRIKKQCSGNNLILLSTKLVKDRTFNHAFVSTGYTDVIFLSNTSSTNCYLFPVLLVNPDRTTTWNVATEYLSYLDRMGATARHDDLPGVIGYIYAVLFSSRYKTLYKACLKQGTPRIPLTNDKTLFSELHALGKNLVLSHLLADHILGTQRTCTFHAAGDCMIKKAKGERLRQGRFYINELDYFDGLSDDVLAFQVGKYRVVNKWIDDRIGHILDASNAVLFTKMVDAIKLTLVEIRNIDDCIASHGGFMKKQEK